MAGTGLTVLQLLPALRGGGVEQGTLEVAGALVREGHRALVVSGGGDMVQPLRDLGAEHLQWPVGAKSPLTLALAPRLRGLLLREGVDVVHPRSRVPAWLTWLTIRSIPVRRRPRLVTTVHGFYRVGRYSAIMTRGERVICVSESIRDYVRAHYPQVPASRLVTIPRGIDHRRYPHGFTPATAWFLNWRASMAQATGRRMLLLPARLTRLKGHEDLLWLVGRLVGDGVDVHALVAGGEDPRRAAYAAGLREQAARTGIQDRVSFLGQRADLRELMAVSDAVLSLSSQPESFGRVVLEALTLGRPAVGYDHGGVGEILAAKYPQGAVPPGDREALYRVTRRVLEHPHPVPPGREFPLDEMLAGTLSVYRELARDSRGERS
jgi:glycosyltransferase involved in cell wall biosynthesis